MSIPSGVPATFGVLATKNETHVTVLFWNHNLPNMSDATPTVTACVTVRGYSAPVVATVTQIDETHANAPRLWLKMASPAYPNAAQIAALKTASDLALTRTHVPATNGALTFTVSLAPYSIVAYSFPLPS